MRAAVRAGIHSGKRLRQLSRELGLSLQTISAIRKALSENGYRSYRERGKTERKKKTLSSFKTVSKKRPRGRPVRTKYGTIYLP
ncbi:hypothetical protein C4587_02415 [Candidatus Parcubacteria bacterium]|nr:MAG: hypothetical protein C4587_02415 [Candidatus Parcubacteria bacterium]